MVNAQQWLDENYPIKERSEIKELDISFYQIKKELEGELKLKGFTKLERLDSRKQKLSKLEIVDCCSKLKTIECYGNELTELNNLKNCPNLETLSCSNNLLTNLDLSSNKEIKVLQIKNNNFAEQNLEFIKHLIKLHELELGNNDEERINRGIYNRFVGSLGYLGRRRFSILDIDNTDIDSGVKHLVRGGFKGPFGKNIPTRFSCQVNKRPGSKCENIRKLFAINENGKVEVKETAQGWIDEELFDIRLKGIKELGETVTQQSLIEYFSPKGR